MRSWLKRHYDKCAKPQTIYVMTSSFSHWNAKFRRRCNCRSFEAEAIPLASRALSHKSCQRWIIFSGMPEFHLGSTLYPVSHPFRHLSAESWKEQVVKLTRATRKLQIVFPSHLHPLHSCIYIVLNWNIWNESYFELLIDMKVNMILISSGMNKLSGWKTTWEKFRLEHSCLNFHFLIF